MNIVFFGSSKYSTIIAQALHKKFGLIAVVTIPDRPIGRKKVLTPSPVKQFAADHKIPVIATDSLSRSALADLGVSPLIADADFSVVADYGLIVPNYLLAIPKYAPLNVHHSLLPKYRGPSPAPTAILNGDKLSGVTIIKMTDEVDAGPILAQREYALKPDETTDSLLTTLNTLGGELVVGVIKDYKSITPKPQDELKASMTKRMTKEDGFIDLTHPPTPQKLDRMIRAYFPWPSVWTKWEMENGKWKILKFLPHQKLQTEGGKPMSLKDFLNGYPEMKEIVEKLF